MSESVKNDIKDGKDPWELLSLPLIKWYVKVCKFGASKYGANTWQGLSNGYQRYKAAFFRHVESYEEGERYDKESGLPHLAHAAWNALAMLYFDMLGKALFPLTYNEEKKNKED